MLRQMTFSAIAAILLSAPADAGDKVVKPFTGKDLKGWKTRKSNRKAYWTVGKVGLNPKNPRELMMIPTFAPVKNGAMVNTKSGGVDIYSEQKFGDCRIEIEVMVPMGSNSGIYVMGEYEVQILDSYGREKVGAGDIGALYGAAPPRVNAAKKPGVWQQFVIDFKAPRFKDGKRVSKAKFVKIELNGKVIQENVEMNGPTPSCLTGREAPIGPILFQGDHGPVAYRNIRVTPK